jgi:hypothetical protein
MTEKIKERILKLLDKIEALLINTTKIQAELFSVLSELPQIRTQSEIEEELGIKIYLGKNLVGGGGQENITISEEDIPYLEERFCESVEELWK